MKNLLALMLLGLFSIAPLSAQEPQEEPAQEEVTQTTEEENADEVTVTEEEEPSEVKE